MARIWRRLAKDPLALVVTVAAVIVAAIAAPMLAPFDPTEQFFEGLTLEGAPLPPNERFLLGTDLLGRDLLTRLLYGARTSLLIGVVANGAAVVVGTLLGVIAGYFQGWAGAAIMRFTDLMMAFPALLLAIALAAIFTPSLWIVAMVIALVNWVQIARVIYTETTALVAREYIEAARALGAAWPRILFLHVLPHLIPTILVWATLGIARIAQSFQQDLAAVGIKAELKVLAQATVIDAGGQGTAPMLWSGGMAWIADYPDPSNFYGPILGCGGAVPGGWNWAKYCNEEIDALAAKADGMAGAEQAAGRIEMWRGIYNRIMDDAPWVPVFNEVRFAMHSARIGGKDIFFTDPIHIPVHYEYVYAKDVE